MKAFLTVVTVIIWITISAQTKDSLVTSFYPNGQPKEKGYFDKAGLKNGEFLYYASNGDLDSSITFINGKLNGLKKIYYSEDDIFCFDYNKNKLVSHKIYDSTNHLKYESPLNINHYPKTKYQFSSGREYYAKGQIDTLIINQDIPYLNEHVYFPGATLRSVGKYAWQIKSWNPQPNSTNGRMVIDVYQFIVESPETVAKKSKRLRREVILVPIK